MRVPGATYRLQLHASFTLHDALAILDYLHALGITDLYLSPIFQAEPGSTHGYDVLDPTVVSETIGGRAALERLAEAAHRRDMALLLDIVPNHMAASATSPWWRDVLRRGHASEYAPFFDIDWGTPERPRPVLLPLLNGSIEEVIARDELKLAQRDDGEFQLEYFDTALPLALERCRPDVLADYQGASAQRRPELLREILAAQHYRLEHWRTAGRRLGYRRFFDITGLVGVRVEREEVFRATHSLIAELVEWGIASGLRVDHIDGLRDPAGYLERLRALADTYVVVEKILDRDEVLPSWPVAGTTGYELLNVLNGLFMNAAGHEHIVHAYHRITGDDLLFDELVYQKKKLVMERLFGGETAALTTRLQGLLGTRAESELVRRMLIELTAAMPIYRTYICGSPVEPADRAVLERALSDMARREPDLAARFGERLRQLLLLEQPEERDAALEFVQRWQQYTGPVMAKGFEDTALYVYTPFISANEVGSNPAEPALGVEEFHRLMELRQQRWPHALSTTATHDTKRGEDARARLNVLSELADEWPRLLRRWARRSEQHKEQAAAIAGLEEEDAPLPNSKEESLLFQTLLGAWPLDAGPDEDFVARINEYMTKAVREGKESSSWGNPDPEFEAVLAAFIDQLLAEPWDPELRTEIGDYAARIAWPGALNSLAQTLLKITCPGVPDFYQGTELWSLSLVDPDNRRRVDYRERREHLDRLEPLLASPTPDAVAALLREWRNGAVKLYLTTCALRFRRARPALFGSGDYLPLAATGALAGHVVGFARTLGHDVALVIVSRLLARSSVPDALPAPGTWGDTAVGLPASVRREYYRNVLTGEVVDARERLRLAELLAHFPVALLEPA